MSENDTAPRALPQDEGQVAAGRVSAAEVRHVAELANLRLTPAEEPVLERDLNAILDYVAMLGELETSSVEPMAQVVDVLSFEPDRQGGALRQDEPRPSLERKAVLAEAPETDGRFFKVPKVIER